MGVSQKQFASTRDGLIRTSESIFMSRRTSTFQVLGLKGIVHPKDERFCHHLLTLVSFQTSSAEQKRRYFEECLYCLVSH